MEPTISTIAERPELADVVWTIPTAWPEFMRHDPFSDLYYDIAAEAYPEFVLIAMDGDRPVARACAAPFTLDGEPPDSGWDGVIVSAWRTRLAGRHPNAISALEIMIDPDLHGQGLSAVMVGALRSQAAALGFTELLAPVRPSAKHLWPTVPITDYVGRARPDGLPEDPWLRVHARAGATFGPVAHTSMTIPGTLAQWRAWTGLPFGETGPVKVPGALVPVHCDVEQGHAVYVEPNIWMRHPL